MKLNVTSKGLDLIKKYEGCRLNAYKPVAAEKYYTIGYGHYGPDVKSNMKITKEQAEEYLLQDVQSAVNAVNAIGKNFNQNQFDALVSFTYNCGAGNLRMLCNGRTIDVIGDKITLYNKGANKQVLAGLVKRRAEEQALYKAQVVLKNGSRGDDVKKLQNLLNEKGYDCGKADGIFGVKTQRAVEDFQMNEGIAPDGIVGPVTWTHLQK